MEKHLVRFFKYWCPLTSSSLYQGFVLFLLLVINIAIYKDNKEDGDSDK